MSVFSWWNNWLQERGGGSHDPAIRARIEKAEAEARAARAENQPHMLRARALERYEAARADYFKGSPVELEGRPMTQREALGWEMGKTRSAIQAAMEHEIEGFVGRGVDADVARRLVRGGGGNDKGAVFQLSHDYHVLERRLAALDAAEASGAAPAPESEPTGAEDEYIPLDMFGGYGAEEAEPEVPGAHVEPEVPDVMADSLQRWQTAAEALAKDLDAQLQKELQETERRRRAHKAQKEQQDAAQQQDHGQGLQL